MELVEYKFEAMTWPPPDSYKKAGQCLFGFDVDNQPYVLAYETKKGQEGWIASTVAPALLDDKTAHPMCYNNKEVNKLIKAWAPVPLSTDAVGAMRLKNNGKK